MLRWLIALCAIALAVSSCSDTCSSACWPPARSIVSLGPDLKSSSDPVAVLARETLRAWARYPVAARRTPLLVYGDPADEQDLGRLAATVPIPSGPASASGYPLISARTAIALITEPGLRTRITRIWLGTRDYLTNQGEQPLPTWFFRVPTGPPSRVVSMLAVRRPYVIYPTRRNWPFWSSGYVVEPNWDFVSTVSHDRRTVTISFEGSPASIPGSPTVCAGHYHARAFESPTGVVAVVTDGRGPAIGHTVTHTTLSDIGCPLIGANRSVSLRLAHPLGRRVLLDITGAPIPDASAVCSDTNSYWPCSTAAIKGR